MARGNLAAVRGAAGACKEAERWVAARRRKSLTPELAVRLALQSVGTATEGSTLVRDLTRPLKDSLRSRPARAGVARSAASGAKAPQAPQLNPRPPKSNRESCETHNANEPAYAPARARTRAISSRLGPNIPGAAPPASRHKMESWPRWWMV